MKAIRILYRLSVLFVIIVAVVQFYAPASAATQPVRRPVPPGEKIPLELQNTLAEMQADQMITVIVTLNEQADLSFIPGATRAARLTGIIRALQAVSEQSQASLRFLIDQYRGQGKAADVVPFWVFNGLSVTATAEVIQELAARSDVMSVTPDQIDIEPSAPLSTSIPEANISAIHANELWSLGFTGQGVVVAAMDSGVDASHPDLAAKWRGGSNSWYDPYGQHAAPADLAGHGTQTMGVIVGGDAGGTSIGVAPGAQWIAVKIFNDSGSATATAIHLGFQWLLDPDGNPGTDDAPDVVNNSWTFGTPGCNLEFQLDVQTLYAAAILPIFAAGNTGPAAGTSVSPANYPEAFAVGAVDDSGQIFALSSRGPSTCGESEAIYPELTAPGVEIRTSDLAGFYTSSSGTSLAAPHAAGVLALLLNAFPNLTAEEQAAALLNGANDLGPVGPDNDYGFGMLDALAAYNRAGSSVPVPTPTLTPSPTPTPIPQPAVHIGDLDAVASASRKGWTASVTVRVHDLTEKPISGVTVYANWSGGISLSKSCKTNTSGVCTISSGNIPASTSSAVFTITKAVRSGQVYNPSANHDPDGDSNGTSLTVIKP